jgi:hypothetical protein
MSSCKDDKNTLTHSNVQSITQTGSEEEDNIDSDSWKRTNQIVSDETNSPPNSDIEHTVQLTEIQVINETADPPPDT